MIIEVIVFYLEKKIFLLKYFIYLYLMYLIGVFRRFGELFIVNFMSIL